MFPFLAFFSQPAWQSNALHAILAGPLGLMLLDLLTGVSSSVKSGTFRWTNLADILKNDVLKYLGGGLAVGVASTGLNWSSDTNLVATLLTMLGVSASTIASILTNIREMLPANSVEAPLLKGAESFLEQVAVDQKPTVSMPAVTVPPLQNGSMVFGDAGAPSVAAVAQPQFQAQPVAPVAQAPAWQIGQPNR